MMFIQLHFRWSFNRTGKIQYTSKYIQVLFEPKLLPEHKFQFLKPEPFVIVDLMELSSIDIYL